MRTGRSRATVTLTLEERQQLDSLADRSRSAPDVARRARIILACAEGRETTAVAKRARVSPTTVCKWRTRFLDERLDGLFDEPWPGAPRTISDAHVEQVVIRTLGTTPRGATHWSVRDMAKVNGISPSSVNRIWRAFGLQPHRAETFKLSPDPLLIDKIRDIIGLYISPPEHAVVLCVDEKAQILFHEPLTQDTLGTGGRTPPPVFALNDHVELVVSVKWWKSSDASSSGVMM